MARRVFLHLGLPKTATTYVQSILWHHRDRLREHGVLLPGRERREHLWSSRIVRGQTSPEVLPEGADGAWDRITGAIADWGGTALVSHEFFAAASSEQAARVLADLAPAEVHLVLTARHPLALLTASWQEALKTSVLTTPLHEYGRGESDDPRDVWDWRTMDLRRVLERWAPHVPAARVHVITLGGPDAPRDTVWQRFAGLIGVDPSAYPLDATAGNPSMGVAESETMRRVNAHVRGFDTALDRGTILRRFLAEGMLVPRGGAAYLPARDQVEDCRRRGEATVDHVRQHGFHVVGELSDLLVPAELPALRQPADVTDAEVAEIAVELVASLVTEVRDLRRERQRLRGRLRELRSRD